MDKRVFRLFLIFTVFLNLLPGSLRAQERVSGAALVRGSLGYQFARHTLTLHAWNPAQPLTVLLEYSPQGRWELDDRSGFFIFDQAGFDRFRNGEIPGSVSIAAGDRLPGAGRRLQATLGAPVSGNFIIVIYNDSPIPMGYTLRATNGGFDDDGGQVFDSGAPAPSGGGAAELFPLVIVPGPTPTPLPTPAPIPPLRASALRGLLDARYAQDFFTLEVRDTGLPLTVEMTYDPPEQILLLDSLNFWMFDEEQFRTQEISGARPEFQKNRAAGKLIYRDERPIWVATIEQPLDRYVVVVNQHQHTLSVGFRLSVDNGVLLDEGQQAQAVDVRLATQTGVGSTLWVVSQGETLGSIALAIYGDRRYYAAICAVNRLSDCNRLVPGQRLILPPAALLPPATSSSPVSTVPSRPTGSGLPVDDNVLEIAAGESSLQTFRDLISPTGLNQTLRSAGPYTLFAFRNDAFDALPSETQDALLAEPEAAFALLSNHVVSGRLDPAGVTRTKQIISLNGRLLRLDPDGRGRFTVNGVALAGEPIEAANGVIFVIGEVIE